MRLLHVGMLFASATIAPTQMSSNLLLGVLSRDGLLRPSAIRTSPLTVDLLDSLF
jgi:hypothetical protein